MDLYVQIDFLKEIINDDFKCDSQLSKNGNINSLLINLLTKSNILIDQEISDIDLDNPYWKKIINSFTESEEIDNNMVICQPEHFENLDNNLKIISEGDIFDIYFLKNKPAVYLGCFVTDSKNFYKDFKEIYCKHHTLKFSKTLNKPNKKDWQEFLSILSDFESGFLIMSDFFISNSNDLINNFSLISTILPRTSNINYEFKLTIITQLISDNKSNEIFNIIINNIKKLNLNYKVLLKIYFVEGNSKLKIHDRDIITNKFRINSGYGFILFKRDTTINIDTTLTLVPLVFEKIESGDIYKDFLKEYKMIFNNSDIKVLERILN
jgi:hypothetical protein